MNRPFMCGRAPFTRRSRVKGLTAPPPSQAVRRGFRVPAVARNTTSLANEEGGTGAFRAESVPCPAFGADPAYARNARGFGPCSNRLGLCGLYRAMRAPRQPPQPYGAAMVRQFLGAAYRTYHWTQLSWLDYQTLPPPPALRKY
jgi:hypothetical protein